MIHKKAPKKWLKKINKRPLLQISLYQADFYHCKSMLKIMGNFAASPYLSSKFCILKA